MTLSKLKKELNELKNPEKIKIFKKFFKTGKDEYGEGDEFLGLSMPQQRIITKKYDNLSLNDLQKLLDSKIHEYRMSSLIILCNKYKKSSDKEKKEIYEFYIKNFNNINNWDLVDVTSPNIVGEYLLNKDRKILYDFAKSNHLWKKRIAIISTYAFIKNNDFIDSLKISRILLHDKHDLIHKAVGWMLREIGKRNQDVEEAYLKKYYKVMPRTMLRYAIEKFSDKKRKFYMQK